MFMFIDHTNMKMDVSQQTNLILQNHWIMPRSFLVKSKKSYNVHRPIDTEQSQQKLPDPAPKTSKWLYYISVILNWYWNIYFIFNLTFKFTCVHMTLSSWDEYVIKMLLVFVSFILILQIFEEISDEWVDVLSMSDWCLLMLHPQADCNLILRAVSQNLNRCLLKTALWALYVLYSVEICKLSSG